MRLHHLVLLGGLALAYIAGWLHGKIQMNSNSPLWLAVAALVIAAIVLAWPIRENLDEAEGRWAVKHPFT